MVCRTFGTRNRAPKQLRHPTALSLVSSAGVARLEVAGPVEALRPDQQRVSGRRVAGHQQALPHLALLLLQLLFLLLRPCQSRVKSGSRQGWVYNKVE